MLAGRLCSLDPSTGFSHECRNIPYQGSCVATCTTGYEADGSISTTSFRCLSPGDSVSDAHTVYPSCSQILCSDILIQNGVSVSHLQRHPSGDTGMVFRDGGYQADLNDTPTLTCAHHSSENTVTCVGWVKFLFVLWSLVTSSFPRGWNFPSNSASTTKKRVLFALRYVTRKPATGMSPSVIHGSNGHFQGSLECAEALAALFNIRMLVECMLS